jgi:D-tyrosyl-tRNA(Tyr) deacylase
MRVVLQRVSQASVTVDQQKVAEIEKGLLVLVGIEDLDT